MKTIASMFLAAVCFLVVSEAGAACTCQCVDGAITAVCTKATDVPPVCGQRTCPAPPPESAPQIGVIAVPAGTTYCFPAQVLNRATKKYQWMSVCK